MVMGTKNYLLLLFNAFDVYKKRVIVSFFLNNTRVKKLSIIFNQAPPKLL